MALMSMILILSKLEFIKPGTTAEGTIQSVEQASRGAHTFLEISWLVQGQTIRESHFMTNYDEIVEAIGKIGLSVDTDTDTWIGTPAKLLIESNNGYLNATIVGPAETITPSGDGINFEAKDETATSKSVDDLLD